MNYKLISLDPIESTMLIEWEDGITLNHNIPYLPLKDYISRGSALVKDRPEAVFVIDRIIKTERV